MVRYCRLYLCLAAVVTSGAVTPTHGGSSSIKSSHDETCDNDKVVPASSFSPLGLDHGVLSWMHNVVPGGYYNPKQEFRHADPNDPTSLSGIFAKDRISKGEVLCRVPWEYVVKEEEPARILQEDNQLACGMVRELAKQMALGAASKYGPYVEYLNQQPDNQIPSVWSTAGQELLLEIVGQTRAQNNRSPDLTVDSQWMHFSPNHMFQWMEDGWFKVCRGDRDDPIGIKAALMALLRADDDIMIPAYDFYNHRNGKWQNAVTDYGDGEPHETRAKRTIEAGEQIYISYNRCIQCSGRIEGTYGTAEIFRDYGFVEEFPQRWHYYKFNTIEFELLHDELYGYYEVEWVNRPEPGDLAERVEQWLIEQVIRLERLWHVKYQSVNREELGIPKDEWDKAWVFSQANIVAMKCAINALRGNNRTLASELELSSTNLYYNLEELDYWQNVDSGALECRLEEFDKYSPFDTVSSLMQTLDFSEFDNNGRDVCMDRNQELHVCSSFRPFYYEQFVHPMASLIDSVRRVLIIGSGASFMVHEVMKYNSTLELLVAIEADQIVARACYERFYVDPRFDDPRVEWWYGESGETLSFLPDSYWNSFDLVLVDMTKANFPATFRNGMEFNRLVNDKGIFVSHNNQMVEMSRAFTYAARIIYQVMPGCAQALTLGSHSVDFLHATAKDHEIETFVYDASSMMKENRMGFIHDFQKGGVPAAAKVKRKIFKVVSSDEVGSIQLVEVAGVTLISLRGMTAIIKIVLNDQGFTEPTPIPLSSSDSVLVIMTEGYVLARFHPVNKYVALDVYLSSRTSDLDMLKRALVEKLGTAISTIRLVTNGMERPETIRAFGKERTLPVVESSTLTTFAPLDAATVPILLQEIGNVVLPGRNHALVVCQGGVDCPLAQSVKDAGVAGSVHVLEMAPGLQETTEASLQTAMIACETNVASWIAKTIESKEIMVDAIFLDAGLSPRSLQVLDALFNLDAVGSSRFLERKEMYLLALTSGAAVEHRGFAERFHRIGAARKRPKWWFAKPKEASVKAEFQVVDESKASNSLISLVVQGMENTKASLLGLETDLSNKLGGKMTVRIQHLQGGPRERVPVRASHVHSDYEPEDGPMLPGHALGAQSFFQADKADESQVGIITMDLLLEAVLETFARLDYVYPSHQIINGNTAVFEFDMGHLVVSRFPNERVDFNMFHWCPDDECVSDDLKEFEKELFSQIQDLVLFSFDIIPRGPHKVVDFYSMVEEDDES